jgi:NAD(P)-dependent dehydrogenase (short-subunit alcohol dehydrogenase family)
MSVTGSNLATSWTRGSVHGGIDVLHNNTGVVDPLIGHGEALKVETFDPNLWDKVIAINLTAALIREAICPAGSLPASALLRPLSEILFQ